jgi:four helix bundle protein
LATEANWQKKILPKMQLIDTDSIAMGYKTFRELTAYRKAFDLAMIIYKTSNRFPLEERYSLTDQIRRSSRSVASSIAEAYRKRSYPNYFVSKVSDADMENTETQAWLEFSLACDYITKEEYIDMVELSDEVGRLLNHMFQNPEKYLTKKQREDA